MDPVARPPPPPPVISMAPPPPPPPSSVQEDRNHHESTPLYELFCRSLSSDSSREAALTEYLLLINSNPRCNISPRSHAAHNTDTPNDGSDEYGEEINIRPTPRHHHHHLTKGPASKYHAYSCTNVGANFLCGNCYDPSAHDDDHHHHDAERDPLSPHVTCLGQVKRITDNTTAPRFVDQSGSPPSIAVEHTLTATAHDTQGGSPKQQRNSSTNKTKFQSKNKKRKTKISTGHVSGGEKLELEGGSGHGRGGGGGGAGPVDEEWAAMRRPRRYSTAAPLQVLQRTANHARLPISPAALRIEFNVTHCFGINSYHQWHKNDDDNYKCSPSSACSFLICHNIDAAVHGTDHRSDDDDVLPNHSDRCRRPTSSSGGGGSGSSSSSTSTRRISRRERVASLMVDDLVRRHKEEEMSKKMKSKIHDKCAPTIGRCLVGDDDAYDDEPIDVPPTPPPNSLLLMRQWGLSRNYNRPIIMAQYDAPGQQIMHCTSTATHRYLHDDDDAAYFRNDIENMGNARPPRVPAPNMNHAGIGHGKSSTLFLDMTNDKSISLEGEQRPGTKKAVIIDPSPSSAVNSTVGSRTSSHLWERRSIPRLADIEVERSLFPR